VIESFIRVPSLILMTLYEGRKNLTQISRNIDISFAYATRIVNQLVSIKFIDVDLFGRNRFCFLTDKGKKVARRLILCRSDINKGE